MGRDWGQAPTRVEAVPARLTFPVSAERIEAWALDERGQRQAPLAVEAGPNGRAAITLGPPQRTRWYEVQVR